MFTVAESTTIKANCAKKATWNQFVLRSGSRFPPSLIHPNYVEDGSCGLVFDCLEMQKVNEIAGFTNYSHKYVAGFSIFVDEKKLLDIISERTFRDRILGKISRGSLVIRQIGRWTQFQENILYFQLRFPKFEREKPARFTRY